LSGINFDLPLWMLLLCLVGGLTYAAALYFKNKNFTDKGRWLRSLLAFLRLSLVTILLSLLLNPFLQSITTEVKDPIIALIQDNSQSVGSWLNDKESTYTNGINEMRSSLESKFQVDDYSLGGNIEEHSPNDSLSYKEELSNLSNLKSLIDEYEGENLSAIILATDGIYNQGKSPVYVGLPRHIPIYGLALGDTSKRRDALIKNVYHNNIAYLDYVTNIQFDIKADNCQGSRAKLIIEEEISGQFTQVKEEDIGINSEDFFRTLEISLELKRPGVAHYRARLRGIGNEVVYANNVKDIFIEVLDARQIIRILAHSPHPDISALKTFLSENKNYEVLVNYMSENPSPNSEADIVIFHNLPSSKYSIDPFLSQMDRRRVPRIFVTGQSTSLDALNKVQDIVIINGKSGSINEVQGEIQNNFSLFTLSDELKSTIKNFPPLLAPFGEYKLGPSSQVLMTQKIGNIDTEYPLIAYQNKAGIRSSIICAEGMWKWKLFDYLERQNFDITKELVSKSITYTSIKEDRRKFRVSSQEKIYNENQEITFTAELYNDNYELVNEADVFFVISNQQGDDFNYTFTKKGNYYTLDIGSLAPGRYSYAANANHSGTEYKETGQITVQEIQYELYNLEANHSLLYALAERQNGAVVNWNEASNISSVLTQNEDLKPVLYQYMQNKSIIDFKWLFFILMGFLGLEWFFRRYNGSL
jgi:hypothetical protein